MTPFPRLNVIQQVIVVCEEKGEHSIAVKTDLQKIA
jgi:hypothetical protein